VVRLALPQASFVETFRSITKASFSKNAFYSIKSIKKFIKFKITKKKPHDSGVN